MNWTLQDAKNRFSAVVDAATRHQPQFVTRRGKPAVVVLATSDYERLCALQAEAKPNFKEFLLQGPVLAEDKEWSRKVEFRDIEF